jgi:hypothetical protein
MFGWIYDTPLTVAASLMALLFVGFTWLGSIFLAPILRLFVRSRAGATNDIVGNIISSFGVLYGILLGLVAVAAYQNWSNTEAKLIEEADAIRSLYVDVSTYPEPFRQDIGNALIEVLEFSVGEEWEKLRQGSSMTSAIPQLKNLRSQLFSYEPQTKLQDIVHAQAIGNFKSFLEKRRFRIYSVAAGIPPVLWYVVIIGAIFNIVLIWLLDMKFITQLFLGGMLAFFLGAMILMIARLDKPFLSEDGVSPGALVSAYQVIADDLNSNRQ